MSKFKVEHGASKVNLVLLKTNIEDTISQDIDLMSTWSNNDRKYIVNELLRFALTQEEDFQKYKTGATANTPRSAVSAKPLQAKPESSPTSTAAHARRSLYARVSPSSDVRPAAGRVPPAALRWVSAWLAASSLHSLYPVHADDPLLRLIAYERPPVFHALVHGYDLFLYTTPFLFFSLAFSLAYIHLYRKDSDLALGILPTYPDPRTRRKLSLVIGEVHRQLVPNPGPVSVLAHHPRARPLYRHCLLWFYWFGQDLWADSARDAPVVRVSRRRPGTEALRHRPRGQGRPVPPASAHPLNGADANGIMSRSLSTAMSVTTH